MATADDVGRVWVFGDYRNYFQNRVTLQLIAKGKELARRLGTKVAVVVLGEQVSRYAMEYVAHGADVILAAEHPRLKDYLVESYSSVLAGWVAFFKPDILIGGATSFGREFFPRLAKRLGTGLSADCVSLEVDRDTGLLHQTTPAFGGELMADVVTHEHRPQMATVHPGIFEELPHDSGAVGSIVYPEPGLIPEPRVSILDSRQQRSPKGGLDDAQVVVAGGRGLGSKAHFQRLYDLAQILEGEVGATRPAIRAGWAEEERLLGQTGKSVKARLVITVGTSGALQYTTGIQSAETIVAINRDPNAPIFRIADLGLVGDAAVILPMLLDELRKRV